MVTGSCHCGKVGIEVTENPKFLVDCNCSICRRLGALWGHVPIGTVKISAPDNATSTYIQGNKTLAVHTCKTCGCTTHWESLQPEGQHMAVNFRMCDPETYVMFQIRKFDGADSWKFVD